MANNVESFQPREWWPVTPDPIHAYDIFFFFFFSFFFFFYFSSAEYESLGIGWWRRSVSLRESRSRGFRELFEELNANVVQVSPGGGGLWHRLEKGSTKRGSLVCFSLLMHIYQKISSLAVRQTHFIETSVPRTTLGRCLLNDVAHRGSTTPFNGHNPYSYVSRFFFFFW